MKTGQVVFEGMFPMDKLENVVPNKSRVSIFKKSKLGKVGTKAVTKLTPPPYKPISSEEASGISFNCQAQVKVKVPVPRPNSPKVPGFFS